MNAHLAANLAVLEELYHDLAELIRPLDADCLNWTPPIPEMNSIAALVTHVTGSLNTWLSRALDEPFQRDRDAEFHARHTADELLAMVERSQADLRRRLPRIEQVDPSAIRHVRRLSIGQDADVSVAWCIEHAVIHAGEHWGQIQLNRQLYAAQKGQS